MSAQNLYILVDFSPNKSLDKHIDKGRGIMRGGIEALVFYTACVLNALEYMHKVTISSSDPTNSWS